MLFHYWVFMIPTCCVLLSMKWLSFSLCLNSLNWLLTHIHTRVFFFFFCSCSIYLLLRPLTMTLSPSLPPDVCLNPSLSLSVYLPPSPMRHRSFSSGNELFCLLSLILSTGNNSLSSLPLLSPLSPPSPVSCRVHRILSALSGTMATRKLL